MSEESPRRNHLYGGQALIEGVMMRGKDAWAVAVRRPDQSIHTESHDIDSVMNRHPILARPGFRGVIALGQALAIGYKALMISADASQEEEEHLSSGQMAVSVSVAMILFLGIFMVVPIVAVGATNRWLHLSPLPEALIEGFIRIGLFVGYIWGIGRMKEVRRTFEYHGAEHKTIAAYEHDEELTPDNVDKYSTLHVRCGTNFLFLTFGIAVIVFAVLTSVSGSIWWKIGVRVVGVPLVAACAYEMLRLGARFEDSRAMRIVMAPGLWLQKITTQLPDRSQIEVAIASFNTVLAHEREKLSGNS